MANVIDIISGIIVLFLVSIFFEYFDQATLLSCMSFLKLSSLFLLLQVQMVSFQCSPLSTPDGIVSTFRQCAQFQKDKDLKNYVSVVVLDEIGLAEDSPRMPLKVNKRQRLIKFNITILRCQRNKNKKITISESLVGCFYVALFAICYSIDFTPV